ncbi:unnamed protein product [Ectocarpus sp. CCAP 1310/34]|nr:unnamed protein product [Ectocarpus sp. CCAP 1310/34]
MAKPLPIFHVPTSGPTEGSHVHQFAPEWRKPMSVEPEQIGAFFKPGNGIIEPTLQPPPELKMAGIQGERRFLARIPLPSWWGHNTL